MRRVALLLVAASLTLSGQTSPSGPIPGARNPTRALAGRVLAVEGIVHWRPNAKTAPVKMPSGSPGPFGSLRLYAGDSIRCEPGARITVEIYGRQLALDASVGWYPVPHRPGRQGLLDLGGEIAVVPPGVDVVPRKPPVM